jgi:phage baseplate assembly protein W
MATPIYTGISFPFRKSGVQLPAPATDDDLIKESLKQIILTSPGERLMRPTVGSGARSFVFETNDQLLAAQIRTNVGNSIARLEPRVMVQAIVVERVKSDKSGDPRDLDSVIVTVHYVVPATQKRDEVSVQV